MRALLYVLNTIKTLLMGLIPEFLFEAYSKQTGSRLNRLIELVLFPSVMRCCQPKHVSKLSAEIQENKPKGFPFDY